MATFEKLLSCDSRDNEFHQPQSCRKKVLKVVNFLLKILFVSFEDCRKIHSQDNPNYCAINKNLKLIPTVSDSHQVFYGFENTFKTFSLKTLKNSRSAQTLPAKSKRLLTFNLYLQLFDLFMDASLCEQALSINKLYLGTQFL